MQISERGKRNGSNIVFVLGKYREVDISISNAIKERNHDDWATEVSGRFGLINDLRAEDDIYHKTCNSNFRTLLPLVTRTESSDDSDVAQSYDNTVFNPSRFELFIETNKRCYHW